MSEKFEAFGCWTCFTQKVWQVPEHDQQHKHIRFLRLSRHVQQQNNWNLSDTWITTRLATRRHYVSRHYETRPAPQTSIKNKVSGTRPATTNEVSPTRDVFRVSEQPKMFFVAERVFGCLMFFTCLDDWVFRHTKTHPATKQLKFFTHPKHVQQKNKSSVVRHLKHLQQR